MALGRLDVTKDQIGIVTILFGESYKSLALNFIRSLKKHSQVKTFILTDLVDAEVLESFDFVKNIDSKNEVYLQKINLFKYSPFNISVYIDIDSLFIKSLVPFLDHLYTKRNQIDFLVFGKNDEIFNQYRKFNNFSFSEINEVFQKNDVKHIPVFNGGFYVFKKSPMLDKIIKQIEDDFNMYSKFFLKNRNQYRDESILSFFLSLNHISAKSTKNIPVRYINDIKLLKINNNTRVELMTTYGILQPNVIHFGFLNTFTVKYYEVLSLIKGESFKMNFAERAFWKFSKALLARLSTKNYSRFGSTTKKVLYLARVFFPKRFK